MSSRIKVSVIVPVYNAETYLSDCLTSILSQSLKDIEVICIDDGSTDSSYKQLEQLSSKDSRVIVLSQKNQGAGPARNNGIAHATGEFIAFMDPDDWYPSDQTLENLYKAAERNKALICGGSLVEYVDGTLSYDFPPPKRFQKFDKEGFIPYPEYQFDFGYQRFLFARSLLADYAIAFPDYRRFQDPPFFVRAMIDAGKFYALPTPTYVYRVGYFKKIVWDSPKISGLINGVCDVIEMARDNHLGDLLDLELGRLKNSYFKILFENQQRTVLAQQAYRRLAKITEDMDSSIAESAEALLSNSLVAPTPSSSPWEHEGVDAPLVSVIVPSYNAMEYLPDCLSSIQNQALDKIEIIVVDDGSTDSTLEYITDLAAHDLRIVVASKRNGGLSSARNAGLSRAHGRYVCFVDSDDMLTSKALKLAYDVCDRLDLDQLFYEATPYYESYGMLKEQATYLTYYDYAQPYKEALAGQSLFVELERNGDFKPSACLQLLRRSFLVDNEILFKQGILHEDNLFTLECLSCSKRSAVLSEKLYVRRVRDESIMTSEKGVRNAYGYYCAVVDSIDFFERRGLVLTSEFLKCLMRRDAIMLDTASNHCALSDEKTTEDFLCQLEMSDRLLFNAMVVGRVRLIHRDRERRESIQKLEARAKKNEQKAHRAEADIKKIKSSKSFRIGFALTAAPRYLKKLILNKGNKMERR